MYLSKILYIRNVVNKPEVLSFRTPSLSVLPTKHTYFILTRAYTVLTKSSARYQANAREIFAIWSYTLSCPIHTTPGTVEPNTFLDQETKFGRAFSKVLLYLPQRKIQQWKSYSPLFLIWWWMPKGELIGTFFLVGEGLLGFVSIG